MNHVDKIKGVVKSIEDAFVASTYPGDNNIAIDQEHDPSDGWNCAKVFKGKHWQDVAPASLIKCSAAFLTSEAFCYYLPTYMLARLLHPIEADVAGDYIIYDLKLPEKAVNQQKWQQKMNMLNRIQKNTVKLFLETVGHGSDDMLQQDAQMALYSYWHQY